MSIADDHTSIGKLEPEGGSDCFPDLNKLKRALENSDGSLASVPDIGDLLKVFVESGEVQLLLKSELQIAADNPHLLERSRWDRMSLWQSHQYSLTIERAIPASPSPFITTVAAAGRFETMNATAELALLTYRLPEHTDMSRLDKAVTPMLFDSSIVSDKQSSVAFRRLDIMDLKVVAPTVIVMLVEKSVTPFIWSLDRTTMTPVSLTTASQAYTRCRTLIELIEEFFGTALEFQDGNKLLLEYGGHELHFIRWKACQALAKIKLSEAEPLLHRLARDPHPNVRRAARQAVERISAIKSEQRGEL